jgi:hypothetical protein
MKTFQEIRDTGEGIRAAIPHLLTELTTMRKILLAIAGLALGLLIARVTGR